MIEMHADAELEAILVHTADAKWRDALRQLMIRRGAYFAPVPKIRGFPDQDPLAAQLSKVTRERDQLRETVTTLRNKSDDDTPWNVTKLNDVAPEVTVRDQEIVTLRNTVTARDAQIATLQAQLDLAKTSLADIQADLQRQLQDPARKPLTPAEKQKAYRERKQREAAEAKGEIGK